MITVTGGILMDTRKRMSRAGIGYCHWTAYKTPSGAYTWAKGERVYLVDHKEDFFAWVDWWTRFGIDIFAD